MNRPSLLSTILRSSSIILESKQATEFHTITILASANTEDHTILANSGLDDWVNVKREPIAAAFSEDVGDSAVVPSDRHGQT